MNRKIDSNIISKFQRADQQAYRIIFDQFYAVMLLFTQRYLHDTDDAKDIVQEAFIALWKAKHKFQNEDQIKSFLYITSRNKCLNRIKQIKVREEHVKSISAQNFEVPDFEQEVIHAEFIAQLKMAIDKLSPQRKKIILLNMNGLKNQEIAQELDISLNTVKLQKKIAYQQLRQELSVSLSVLFVLSTFFL